ncbi:MAG TPA: hypothetical protein VFR81_28470, partial [Longimicrobium sp.]|nr:hypothetical protein [Longimicrobium sp.]
NARQTDLLRFICDRGAVPRDQLDGRVLRPLLSQGWVTEHAGLVRATGTGQALAARPADNQPRPAGGTSTPGKLSRAQEEFLRYLLRQTSPVPEDHVDGRILRALLARRLVLSSGGWVSPTDEAAVQLSSHARRDQRMRTRRAERSPQSARAEAVFRAVDQLEAALPLDAELLVGKQPAYADDVLAGLRRFARELDATSRTRRS